MFINNLLAGTFERMIAVVSKMPPLLPPQPPPVQRVASTSSSRAGFNDDEDSDDDFALDENDLTDKDTSSSKSKAILCIGGGSESDDDTHEDEVKIAPGTHQRLPNDIVSASEVSSPNLAPQLANGPQPSAYTLPGTSLSSPIGGQSLIQRTTMSRPLECDYEQSPTPLYLAIEAKEWDAVLEMMENDDYPNDEIPHKKGNRRPYPMSPKQQARCWVVRKEKDGRLRWRLLPIHAAIIFDANATVIDALLEAYPESASQKDDQGMLPLHLAFRNITLLLDDSNKDKLKRHYVSSAEHDETRPSANSISSSTCSSTAVNWLIVEALLTAYPQAIFSRDRKGRTPLQGGIVAAQLALKNENKRKSMNNTPNQRKMAALKVLELYSQIAIRGEKNNWMKEFKLKNDLRLAALSEQHLYRLQDFYREFQEEQKRLHEVYEEKINFLQKQVHLLEEELNYRKENVQVPSEGLRVSLKQEDFDKQERKQLHQEQVIRDLHKQNEWLKKHVENMSKACHDTIATLQQCAQDAERQVIQFDNSSLLGKASCSDSSMNESDETSSVPKEVLSLVDTKGQNDFHPKAVVLPLSSEDKQAHETPSISSSSSKSGRQEFHPPQVVSKEFEDTILSVNDVRLHLLDEEKEHICVQASSCDSSASCKSSLPRKAHHHCFNGSNASSSRCSHTPEDSRDEEIAENANEISAGAASRKQISSEEEEDACAVSPFNSVATSDSLSFDQIKNEILGPTLVEFVVSCNHLSSGAHQIVQSHRKQRSLPLVTIRSDDENDMIAMMNHFSPAPSSSACSIASAVFPGGACAAESFFLTSPMELTPSECQNHLLNMKKNSVGTPYKHGKRKEISSQGEPRHRLSLPDSVKNHLATNQVSSTQQLSASIFVPTSKTIIDQKLNKQCSDEKLNKQCSAVETCASSSASPCSMKNNKNVTSASHKHSNGSSNGGGTNNSTRSLLDTEEEIDD